MDSFDSHENQLYRIYNYTYMWLNCINVLVPDSYTVEMDKKSFTNLQSLFSKST